MLLLLGEIKGNINILCKCARTTQLASDAKHKISAIYSGEILSHALRINAFGYIIHTWFPALIYIRRSRTYTMFKEINFVLDLCPWHNAACQPSVFVFMRQQ